ncbi:MAG TPA: hypoxanthine phosphoribosyltransferase [Syntrophobacteraceae bacterium]|nr:hypoxanthine phosphoribosyltransferase [Syntrophobacteraceae bacterium]HBZ56325.1 hypoxanthine phosphoribosyltransferase [Syntrophobacteraceae bacterium]
MKSYHLTPCISEEEIDQQVARLADQINLDYAGKAVILVCILKGAVVLLADLIRQLTVPVEIDFVRLSSYGLGAETSGTVHISKDVELPIQDRHVLVVEDIIDTGYTMKYLVDYLASRHPKSIKVCALIDKHERRKVEFQADYVGFHLEKGFIVGYGLDYSEKHRQLTGIFSVEFDD